MAEKEHGFTHNSHSAAEPDVHSGTHLSASLTPPTQLKLAEQNNIFELESEPEEVESENLISSNGDATPEAPAAPSNPTPPPQDPLKSGINKGKAKKDLKKPIGGISTPDSSSASFGGDVRSFLMDSSESSVQSAKTNIQLLATNEKEKNPAPLKLEQAEQAVIPPSGEEESKKDADNVRAVGSKPKPQTREQKAKTDFHSTLQANLPTKIKHVMDFKKDKKAGKITSAARNVISVDKTDVVSTYGALKSESSSGGNGASHPGPPPSPPNSYDDIEIAMFEIEMEEWRNAMAAWEAAQNSSTNSSSGGNNNSVPLPPIEKAIETPEFLMGENMIPELSPLKSEFSENSVDYDLQMQEQGVTDEHLNLINTGEIAEFKQGREEFKNLEANLDTELVQIQQQGQIKADADLEEEEEIGRQEMRSERENELNKARDVQEGTKSDMEAKRQEVVDHIESIFKPVESSVTQRLEDLEKQAFKDFNNGMSKASNEFENNVDTRIRAWKKERYGGFWGPAKWLKDKLFGINKKPEVKEILRSEKEAYVNKIENLIKTISERNKSVIDDCHQQVADAKLSIDEYVNGLDGELRAIGESAQFDIEERLAALDEKIRQKEEHLIALLEQKRLEAINWVEEKIEEYKKKWSGAIAKILKFIGEIALFVLKGLLKAVGLNPDPIIEAVKNIAGAIVKIIKDPITFFKNVGKVIGGGFKSFFGGGLSKLFSVVVEWLTNGVSNGFKLPDDWSLKSILMMLLDFMGIGWEMVKNLFTEHLGPKIVDYALSAVDLIQNIIKDGPIAIWRMVKGEGNDSWGGVRGEMADKIGEENVGHVEKFATLVQKMVKEGPGAIWEFIKEQGASLMQMIKDKLIDGLLDWVKNKVLDAGIKLLLKVGSGFLGAILSIGNLIIWFVSNMGKIAALVTAFFKALGDAAAGAVEAGIEGIATAIRLTLLVLLDLLAKMLGISDIPKAIGDAINKVVDSVRNFVSKIVEWVANLLKGLWEKIKNLFTGGGNEDEDHPQYDDAEKQAKVDAGITKVKSLTQSYSEGDDTITKAGAEKVVSETLASDEGKIFTSLKVENEPNNENHNYLFTASPEHRIAGMKKASVEVGGLYPSQDINQWGYVNNAGEEVGGVNLREDPSLDKDPLIHLGHHQKIFVYSEILEPVDWWMVEVDVGSENYFGFVSKIYCKLGDVPTGSGDAYTIQTGDDITALIQERYGVSGVEAANLVVAFWAYNQKNGSSGISLDDNKYSEFWENQSSIKVFDSALDYKAIHNSVVIFAGQSVLMPDRSALDAMFADPILKDRDNRIEWLLSRGGELAKKAFEMICDQAGVDAGKIISFLENAGATLGKIFSQPIQFLKNLIAAVKQGLNGFMANLGENIQSGVISWITGALSGTNITIPETFDLKGIFTLGIQLLGITWQSVRAKLVDRFGEDRVAHAENTVQIIKDVIQNGFSVLWERGKEFLGSLKESFFSAIKGWAITEILQKAVAKVISFFVPGAGLVSAVQSIYKAITFLIDNAAKMALLISNIVSSISNIANGIIAAAADKIKNTLIGAIPVVLDFFAKFLGISGIQRRVEEVIERIRQPIDRAIEKIIDFLKGLIPGGSGDDDQTSDDPVVEQKAQAGFDSIRTKAAAYSGNGATRVQAVSIVSSVKQAHPVFQKLEVVDADGDKDWDISYKYNPEGVKKDLIPGKVERPKELVGKSTPKLDQLEEREAGVSKRYVYEFLNVYLGSKYKVPGDIVAYVEHRAARKLGIAGESQSIAKYSQITGITGLSKPSIDVYDNAALTGESRNRIPDIYKDGVVIGDVKDHQEISYTQQLKDFVSIIKGRGKFQGEDSAIPNPPKKFDLVVRDSKDGTAAGTYVSGPLRTAVRENNGDIYEII